MEAEREEASPGRGGRLVESLSPRPTEAGAGPLVPPGRLALLQFSRGWVKERPREGLSPQ